MRMIDGDRIAELFETAAKRGGGVLATVYRDAAHLARTAPTIEQEGRRGHWNFLPQKNGYLWKCSNCKGNFDQQFSYCPHCGARMDGGADNG